MLPRRKKVIVAIGMMVVLMGIAFLLVLSWIQRAPFRMTLRPLDGHTVVQFEQPDRNLLSDEFKVEVRVETPRTFSLRSGTISYPNVTVDFYDTTLLPGRFRIRVGRTLFDVMERGIIIDGNEHEWHKR